MRSVAKGRGHRVSIDSLHPAEIEPAVQAGAELVLSVNSTNREAAKDWGCEVVAIPDDFADARPGSRRRSKSLADRRHSPAH